jgi:3-isopropylmalate dehydrogenase
VKLYPGVETPIKDKGPEDICFTVVRENTEGLYAGTGGPLKKGTPDEVAIQTSVNTRKGVERCLRYAFEYAQRIHKDSPWKGLTPDEVQRGLRSQLTLVGKTNVLTYAFDLWERAFHEMGREYASIKRDYTTSTRRACGS